ncbi:hypothetical protein [Shouchella lehensis]|uniref:Uncharacterized protein n=1 Tax=Shouchella lehensis TaxID=300825 RepID=A0A4Y7WJH9_9BACI|nr:hypothetical protein [Shouchella lehensis]MBG9785919.1 hypothetical protein [Shouchella lehensis]RQW20220.1 hypothetical protein EH196_08780 [Bacillus sp. C1-1]TES48394.1 hypothetical protein E2L03_14865 [Shouchella lehensis]
MKKMSFTMMTVFILASVSFSGEFSSAASETIDQQGKHDFHQIAGKHDFHQQGKHDFHQIAGKHDFHQQGKHDFHQIIEAT